MDKLRQFKIATLIINLVFGLLLFLLRDSSNLTYVFQFAVFMLGIGGFLLLIKSSRNTKAIFTFIFLGMYGVFIEYTSVKTGFPYSKFVYTDLIGYKLFDTVPWSVFLIWPVLVISAYSVSDLFTKSSPKKILLTVLLLVSYDLVFDPIVLKLGFWEWLENGQYFGVPLQNYIGWLFSSIISALLVDILLNSRIDKLWNFIYLGNIFLWSFMAFLFEFYIPGLIGIFITIFIIRKIK